MYAQQQMNNGALMPGQTIIVNQYTVQVERYLSQGGYAHVYLVRTPTPVFGTTHHVLKRIAVANEALLSEVKKEVDIMRLLRGHPNIVYFIDAAWKMLLNGTYEVFILMEFCSGGGIIDMMNRRLRERLTEKEILQVFVDVCEAVAAMHNLRPPLLHRDLKVENILQSSETTFKLCDFGSAAPVSKPPTNTQEHRLLEADLNRHTTLQYRAPEMVDLYLRRPIDEKSDVWALGVLLYKLCYYTTPFEEHGVLAILNVQYRIPPYPVYSSQLNELIASMLKELGVQRPSVFEVLDRVHKMRVTKSKFTYIQPSRQPVAPRSQTIGPLDGVVSYKPSSMPIPVANSGMQARDKISDAAAPARKDKPRVGSPVKPLPKGLHDDSVLTPRTVDNDAWKSIRPARVHKSGVVPSVAVDVWRSSPPAAPTTNNDPWSVRPTSRPVQSPQDPSVASPNGFGDSLNGLLSASNIERPSFSRSTTTPKSDQRSRATPTNTQLDAFESLNFFPQKGNVPTLGEQRSGLTPQNRSPSLQPSSVLSGLSSSPSNTSPVIKAPMGLYERTANDTFSGAEQRFPSLEELDAGRFPSFSSTPPAATPSTAIEQDPSAPRLPPRPKPSPSAQIERPPQIRPTRSSFTGGSKPSNVGTASLAAPSIAARPDGVRSQHVTGTAMREAKEQTRKAPSPLATSVSLESDKVNVLSPSKRTDAVASATIPQDWLTGDESMTAEVLTNTVAPILRASPEKRSSTILQRSTVSPVVPLWGQTKSKFTDRPSALPKSSSPPGSPKRRADVYATTGIRTPQRGRKSISSSSESADTDDGPEEAASSVLYRPQRRETASVLDTTPKAKVSDIKKADGEEEGSNLRRSHTQVRSPGRKARQSSVHQLVDLWGGGFNNSSTAEAAAAAMASSSAINGISDSVKEESGRRKSVLLSSRIPGLKQGDSQEISGLPSTYTATPTLIPLPGVATLHQRQPSSSRPPSATTNIYSTMPKSTATPSDDTPKASPAKKSRPQSMFTSSPMQKAVSDNPSSTSKFKSPEITKSKSSFTQSLAPPSDMLLPEEDETKEDADGMKSSNIRPPRSPRRSSISNIVSQYESISAGANASDENGNPDCNNIQPPRVASKSSYLDLNLTGRLNITAPPTSPSKPSSLIKPPSSPIKGKISGTTASSTNTESSASRASAFTVPKQDTRTGSTAGADTNARPTFSFISVRESGSSSDKREDVTNTALRHGKSPSMFVGEARPLNTGKSAGLPLTTSTGSGALHKARPSLGGRAPTNAPPLKSITPPRDEPVVSPKPSNTVSENIPERSASNISVTNTSTIPTHEDQNSSSTRAGSKPLQAPPIAPTPERPYQGVSRLIDQWQKKSEEAEGNTTSRGRGVAVRGRREGVVGAGAGAGFK